MLESIIKMSQPQLQGWVAEKINPTIVNKSFIFKRGAIPILLVCHMDTVHSRPPTAKEICRNASGSMLTAPTVGIGGDDRCGIFATMQVLKRNNVCALFTTDEEIGGKGAKKFVDADLKDRFAFAIEIDRRGRNDAVFYDCDSPEFTKFVLGDKFYREAQGSYTDICDVCPAYGMAGVNVSSGYYNAHTTSEYISVKDLDQCIAHVEKMVKRWDGKTFYEYVEKRRSSVYYGNYLGSYGSYPYSYGKETSQPLFEYPKSDSPWYRKEVCSICGKHEYADSVLEVNGEFVCQDCAEDHGVKTDYCDNCDSLVQVEDLIKLNDGCKVCRDCYGVFHPEEKIEEEEKAV